MSTPNTAPASAADAMAILNVAVVAAGPITSHDSVEAWKAALNTAAGEIAAMVSSPRSALRQSISDSETQRTVNATIKGVAHDQKSNRAVVTFMGDKPSTYSKDGTEQARTERLEVPGVADLANALSTYGQQGTKVALTIVNRDREKSDGGKGFRTIVAVSPLS